MRTNRTNLCRTGKVIQKIPSKPCVILKFRDAFTIKKNLLDTPTLNSQALDVISWKTKY